MSSNPRSPSYRKTIQVSDLSKTLSILLQKLRVEHGDSQREASEKLNISSAFISELENGKRNVTLSALEKYSKVYNVDIFMLIFLAEKKWRSINSSKYNSFKKLQEEHSNLYKEKNREYLISELKRLILE